jgi:ATP-dependent DNA ligase
VEFPKVIRAEAGKSPVFAHACKIGLEGIVSKRKTSTCRSGRSPDWLKSKNPGGATRGRGILGALR